MFHLASLHLFDVLSLGAILLAFGFLSWPREGRSTAISPVHAGKKSTHDFKFDPAEVRKRSLKKPPAISLTNLPPQNKYVAAVLPTIQVAEIEKQLRELSGDTAAPVSGKSVTIATRNQFTKQLNLAITYLEEAYAALGVKTQRIAYVVRGKTYYNLEATIPGTVDPDQVIIVGSHLDSTAGNTSRAEAKAPGCDDDASGTSANYQLARALVAMRTAGATIGCTVRLLHFTGEEQGLWGSYTYSDKVANEKTSVIAMLQMDMIGYCAKPGNRVDLHDDVDRNGAHSLVELMIRNIARYNLNLNGFDTHDHAVRDRSDHAGFADHGYKSACISEEFTEGVSGGFNPNYHSVKDDIKSINLPYLLEIVRLLIATVADLADVK